MMKTKMKKRMTKILVVALAIVFAVGFAPQMGGAVYADNYGDPDISLGTDQLAKNANESDAQTVWYGGRDWRVIAYDGKDSKGEQIHYVNREGKDTPLYQSGTVTLFQRDVWNGEGSNYTGDGGDLPDTNFAVSVYKQTLDSIYLNGDNPAFSAQEQSAIVKRTLLGGGDWMTGGWGGYDRNRMGGDDVENVVIWPLSRAEAEALDPDIRHLSEYWLRTPGVKNQTYVWYFSMSIVNWKGDTSTYDSREYLGVRPGFYLDMNKAVFTSSAYGGKASGKIGSGALKKVGENDDGEWKVTLQNPTAEQFKITMEDPEDCVTPKFQYEGAVTGENEYISAVIVDKNDTIKYYGRIKQCAEDADASGELTVSLKGKVKDGDKLLVFNEQCNGDGKTDYSSVPRIVDIPDSHAPHNLSKTDQAAATMTDPGNKEYWTCSKCGRYFGDDGGTQLIEKNSWVIACPSVFNIPAATYNGKEQTPAVKVSDTNAQVISPDNYDVAYGNNINAGTNATAKITFKGDFYSGEENMNFTIKPASIAGASVTGVTDRTYTGAEQTQDPVVKLGGVTLKNGTDYMVSYSGNTNAGTSVMNIAGKGNYNDTKSATFTIGKVDNPLKLKGKKAKVKYTDVKNKAKVLGVTKVINFTNKGKGKKTYAKASGNKKITIAKKTGKVTVKKGLKKGKYKVKVKVKAAGNANYKAATKTVAFIIIIK